MGFVAKFWEEVPSSTSRFKRQSGLGRKSEQFADEVSLADYISIGQPSHSALPDHVHGLDALQRPPRTLKGSIALGQPNSLLNRPVVLFNHVLRDLHWRKTTRPGSVPPAFSPSTPARHPRLLSTLPP